MLHNFQKKFFNCKTRQGNKQEDKARNKLKSGTEPHLSLN